ARGPIPVGGRGDQLAQDAQLAVAEEDEVQPAIVEDRTWRDLEAPPVPRRVAHDGLQDVMSTSSAVDLDPHPSAPAAQERAERGEREAGVAALDRAGSVVRVGLETDPGSLEEEPAPALADVDLPHRRAADQL